MSEFLNTSGEAPASSANGETPVDSIDSSSTAEFPPFNPTAAAELQKQESTGVAKLAVSREEAFEMGKKDRVYSKEEVESFISESVAKGEMSFHDEVTQEEVVESSREAFGDISKRLSFIEQLYPILAKPDVEWNDPELAAVPSSIREEYSDGATLCRMVLSTADKPHKGNTKGAIRYPNGLMITQYYGREYYTKIYLNYQEARKTNDQILDQEALANFETPKTDVEKVKERVGGIVEQIHQAKSEEELQQFNAIKLYREGVYPDVARASDIDAAMELTSFDAFFTISRESMYQRMAIFHNKERAELQKIETELAEAERGMRDMIMKEQEAGLAGKIGMMILPGHREEKKALAYDVNRLRSVADWKRRTFEETWQNWDPNTRRFIEPKREAA